MPDVEILSHTRCFISLFDLWEAWDVRHESVQPKNNSNPLNSLLAHDWWLWWSFVLPEVPGLRSCQYTKHNLSQPLGMKDIHPNLLLPSVLCRQCTFGALLDPWREEVQSPKAQGSLWPKVHCRKLAHPHVEYCSENKQAMKKPYCHRNETTQCHPERKRETSCRFDPGKVEYCMQNLNLFAEQDKHLSKVNTTTQIVVQVRLCKIMSD